LKELRRNFEKTLKLDQACR